MKRITRYFGFAGRANRVEYWLITLLVAAVVLVPVFIAADPYSEQSRNYVSISSIITLWPLLAVQVRRWHDRNKSALWLLMNFVPIIGVLWVIIENGFLAGVDEDNEY